MKNFFKSQPRPQPPPQPEPQPEPEPQNSEDESSDEEEYKYYTGGFNYNKFRNSHRRDDYVPSNRISQVFSHNFPDSEIINDTSEDIKICKIKISSLLNAHVINWYLNRDPDVVRVPSIAKYIYESRSRIQTMFYLNYNFKQDRFEIIDGTHRYTALKMLKSISDENGIIIDERLRDEDGNSIAIWFYPSENIDWLLNSNIIAQINFKSTKDELIRLRDDINYSQPMPIEMRQSQDDIEKNGIVNRIADEYIRRYKKCFADSNNETYLRNERKTSRDKFIVLLSKIYDKYNININRIGTLQQKLEIANDKIRIELSENKIKCNRENIKDRCRETGCYLFLYKDDKLEELI